MSRENENEPEADVVRQPAYDPYFSCNKKIIADLVAEQSFYHCPAGYCSKGPWPGEATERNIWMREVLLNWLKKVCLKTECEVESLALALQLVDRVLNAMLVEPEQYQTVGATCLFMATKLKQYSPFYVKSILSYTDNSVSREDLLSTERAIGVTFKWDLVCVTPIDFFKPIIDFLSSDTKVRKLVKKNAIKIYINCLKNVGMANYLPSYVAIATIIHAGERTHSGNDFQIDSVVKVVTGADRATAQQCYEEMENYMTTGENCLLTPPHSISVTSVGSESSGNQEGEEEEEEIVC